MAWLAVAALTAALVGVVGRAVAVGDPNVGSTPQVPTTEQTTSTRNTGLQQTDTFGYIPRRETTTLQTGLMGPGGEGMQGGGGLFDNVDPPFRNGGPQIAAVPASSPSLPSPAG